MKLKYHIIGFIFVLIIGSAMHFVYELSGKNPIVALFAPVNESTWEHLKLLFYPMLAFNIIEYFIYGKDYENFVAVKATALIIGMFAITASFYTYTGIIGKNFLAADILTFVIGIAAAFIYSYYKLGNGNSTTANIIGIVLIIVFIFMFTIFTSSPPQLQIFADPLA